MQLLLRKCTRVLKNSQPTHKYLHQFTEKKQKKRRRKGRVKKIKTKRTKTKKRKDAARFPPQPNPLHISNHFRLIPSPHQPQNSSGGGGGVRGC